MRDARTALVVITHDRRVPWVLRDREVVPPQVEEGYRALEQMALRARTRRYVS